MTNADTIAIHNAIDVERPHTYTEAANLYLEIIGSKERLSGSAIGKAALKAVFDSLLFTGQKMQAALLAWGDQKFNPEPQEVQRIWRALGTYNKNLIIGAGDLGKSFNMVIEALLDWVEDPWNTNTKFISVTESHMQANVWSTLVDFHSSSKIPLPGVASSRYILMDTNNKQAAIGGVVIPQSDDGKARLQGFHPLPRKSPHPKFGKLTRVRLRIDEGEKVSPGLWAGVDNVLLGEDEFGSVSVAAVTNPESKETPFGQRAEPKDGWNSVDLESSFEWEGKSGFHVTRLDAKQSENVKQKKTVYPGLQTYQGYKNLVSLGMSSARYFTFGRGWYPEQTADYGIFSESILDGAVGEYHWIGLPHNIATFDGAFAEGGDRPILTAGRFGRTDYFTHQNGEVTTFPERWAAIVEQQFPIKKNEDIFVMGDDLITILNELNVLPEWFGMDITGNSWGLFSYLKRKYGNVLGIQWGEAATDRKILEEDSATANEQYEGVVTEMIFAASIWMRYKYLAISPAANNPEIRKEAVGRKYRRPSIKARAESKLDYKSRTGGVSPDYLDSFVMIPHLCRMRGLYNAEMLPTEKQQQPSNWRPEEVTQEWGEPLWGDEETNVEFIDFNT